jgi:formylglycine-generating enzyme required for sulfatase activity
MSVPRQPESFGRNGAYKVVGMIGKGGFATVYKAYHAALDRYVAVKVLRPEMVEPEGARNRFQIEARASARLAGHPNIVTVYDYGEEDGQAYLILQFVDGQTLEKRLHTPISALEIDKIITGVASALDFAHRHNLIHRDIKPSNVLLDTDGTAILSDFGIAKLLDATGSVTNTLLGTPDYMSPEQITGATLDARSDVYALGVMIYRIFAGHPPFRGVAMSILHQHVHNELPPLNNPDRPVPAAVEQVIRRALAKRPDDRPATAGQLASELRQALKPLILADQAQEALRARDISRAEGIVAELIRDHPSFPQGTQLQRQVAQWRGRAAQRTRLAALVSARDWQSAIEEIERHGLRSDEDPEMGALVRAVDVGLAAERVRQEAARRAEQERLRHERMEAARREREAREAARREDEAREAARWEQERQERERREQEALEAARRLQEAQEARRLEREREAHEAARREQERREQERREQEAREMARREWEAQEAERLERERRERLAREQQEREVARREQEARDAARREWEAQEAERLERERRERAEQEARDREATRREEEARARAARERAATETFDMRNAPPEIREAAARAGAAPAQDPQVRQQELVRLERIEALRREIDEEAGLSPEEIAARSAERHRRDLEARGLAEVERRARSEAGGRTGAPVLLLVGVVLAVLAIGGVVLAYAGVLPSFGLVPATATPIPGAPPTPTRGALTAPTPPPTSGPSGKPSGQGAGPAAKPAVPPGTSAPSARPAGAASPTALPAQAQAQPTGAPAASTGAPAAQPTVQPTAPATPLPPTLTLKDGVEMHLVPAGSFVMGSDDLPSASPHFTLTLPAFYVDREEVTNAHFAQFIQETGSQVQGDWHRYADGANFDARYYDVDRTSHPVVNVTWADASAYCQWAGKRLPFEAEWEKAARGEDGRRWPWGNDAHPDFANTGNDADAEPDTKPVGSFPQGASPYGLLDMAGNVREWTASTLQTYPLADPLSPGTDGASSRITRGGSWLSLSDSIEVTRRLAEPAGTAAKDLGFRCAVSADQATRR